MELTVYKPLTENDMFKGVSKTYSQFTSATETQLSWYMVSRDDTDWSGSDDNLKNLFKSFGLAREDDDDWFKALSMVDDWYNAKRMIIIAMDMDDDWGYIDGSTLEINVPTGTTGALYNIFYGSLYNGVNYNDGTDEFVASSEFDVGVYGSSYVYLFPKTSGQQSIQANCYPSGWHMPYSGQVDGHENPNVDYVNSAYAWVANENKRSVPHLRATHSTKAGDIGYDAPYGIAFLERGLIVLFDYEGRTDYIGHTPLSASTIWAANSAGLFVARNNVTGTQNSDGDNRYNISFTGTVADDTATVSYRLIKNDYKMIYFCHAGQGEFNSTTNHTYNHAKGYFRPSESDSIYVTEIALYGEGSDAVLAYAKLSEPVEKNMLETLTFKVELEI